MPITKIDAAHLLVGRALHHYMRAPQKQTFGNKIKALYATNSTRPRIKDKKLTFCPRFLRNLLNLFSLSCRYSTFADAIVSLYL